MTIRVKYGRVVHVVPRPIPIEKYYAAGIRPAHMFILVQPAIVPEHLWDVMERFFKEELRVYKNRFDGSPIFLLDEEAVQAPLASLFFQKHWDYTCKVVSPRELAKRVKFITGVSIRSSLPHRAA